MIRIKMAPGWLWIGIAAGIPALIIGSVAMLLYRQILPCLHCSAHPEWKLLPLVSLAAFTPLAALSGYLAAPRRLLWEAARAGLVVGCFSAASGLILVPPIPDAICPLCLQPSWGLQNPLLVPPSVFWFASRVALGLLLAVAAARLRRFPGPGLRARRPAGST